MYKYDELSEEAQEIIEIAKSQFGDLADNDMFGPFLEEFAPFGDDRMAELLEIAMGKLALLVKLDCNWSIKNFPYSRMVPKHALSLSLVVETIRHFIRSYVEIPNVSSVGAPIADRSYYLERWKGILDDYKKQLDDAAKRLEADLYDSEAAAGMYTKVLSSYPRATGLGYGLPMHERPSYGLWWD